MTESASAGSDEQTIQTSRLDHAAAVDVTSALDPSRRARLQLLLDTSSCQVGFLEFAPDTGALRHKHSHEEIVFVISGSGTFEIEGKVLNVSAGDLAVVPPEASHAPLNTGQDPLQILFFFPSQTVAHTFEDEIAELGSREFQTPLG